VASSAGEFAIVLRDRSDRVDGMLMVVDDDRQAEEIAIALRAAGHDVEVRPRRTVTVQRSAR